MRIRQGFLRRFACACVAASTSIFAGADEVAITSDTFGGLSARALGPAAMSGRITAIDAVPADPLTLSVGSAGGGVWKSSDAGTTFKPIFDAHTQSIGAVRVDPSDPTTIWVGTGESWVRNSVSVGDGVYRSHDGGETWQHMGLQASERIAAVIVDPKDSKTVYACATRPLWSPGEERGVFKTTDGGASWRKVLYVNDSTGCSDLATDPQEPRILYAGRGARLPVRDPLRRALESFATELDALRATVVSTSEAGWLSGEEQLREKLAALYSAVTGYEGQPTASQLARLEVLTRQLAAAQERFESLQTREVGKLNRSLASKKLAPLSQAAWQQRQTTAAGGGSPHPASARFFPRLFTAFSATL